MPHKHKLFDALDEFELKIAAKIIEIDVQFENFIATSLSE